MSRLSGNTKKPGGVLGIIGDSALWLWLFNREKTADATEMKHTQLSTTRLRFLFLAAKIWCHAGRVGVRYSDHYEEKGIFQRLMDRLRSITDGVNGFAPVVPTALRC